MPTRKLCQCGAGDFVLWDNRCTMHRRDACDPAARRMMHRMQIRGDRRDAVRST